MNVLAFLISSLSFVPDSFGFSIAPRPKTNQFQQRDILHVGFSSGDTSRRQFLTSVVISPLIISKPVSADDEQSLTSKLFNPDGSLKDGQVQGATERAVTFQWDSNDEGVVNTDGMTTTGTNGSQFKLSYNLPEKWGTGDKLYIDSSEGVNAQACRHITVYQAPGKVDENQLDKATTIGVGKSLFVIDSLSPIRSADLVGGRKSKKGDQMYYEFDLAVAPKTCAESSENLGLGFCPFDSVYLLSATLMEGKLFVIVVECDKFEWKQANADLKRVRSSFTVEAA
jgi:hypothetical protein